MNNLPDNSELFMIQQKSCTTLAQSYCNQGHISSLLTYLSTFKPRNKEHLDSKEPGNSA